MASKGKNPKPEKDSAKPDPASKKAVPPAEEPEVIPSKESLPPALAPSSEPKKEKQSSSLWGVLLFGFLIVAGGIGGGGFYLYQEQMKFQNETLAALSQLEARLNALDTEADQARQNQQTIDSLNQELQQFKTEMDATLKSHQSSLSTLDEDVMRLKEKVNPPAEAPPTPLSTIDEAGTEAGPAPGELLPESQDGEASEDTEAEEDDSDQESMQFVQWIENFFGAIWNWFAGLFS